MVIFGTRAFGTKLSGFEEAILTFTNGAKIAANTDDILEKIAKKTAEDMKEAARNTLPPSDLTLEIRKALGHTGSEPLVRSGQMIRNIGVKRIKTGTWFIGIPSGIRTPNSSLQLHQIAGIHEGGEIITFRVTEKFLKFVAFLASKGVFKGESRGGTQGGQDLKLGKVFSIIIPPRPFIAPVGFKLRGDLLGQVVEDFTVSLGFVT